MANAAEEFTKKLEAFSSTLTENERRAFKSMIDRGDALSDKDLGKVTGGASASPVARAPELSAGFFSRHVLSW